MRSALPHGSWVARAGGASKTGKKGVHAGLLPISLFRPATLLRWRQAGVSCRLLHHVKPGRISAPGACAC